MNFKVDKNLKIIDEIITFCFYEGFRDYNIELKFENDKTLINIKAKSSNLDLKKIRYLDDILNVERQPEIEEQYWFLGGSANIYGETELNLIGTMIDKAIINFENNILNINLIRNES